MDDGANIIPLRRIPVLTQAEVESIRTPGDIIRIIEANPNREYQVVRGEVTERPAIAQSEFEARPKLRRHSALVRVICLGVAGYAFGISSASSIVHLTVWSGILATASAVAMWMAGWWIYRSR